MITVTIDERKFQAEAGTPILSVAREHNIYIPTLCNNEDVAPYGACRLCMVEITTASGRKRLVTSCLYPSEEGLVVKTNTEKVVSIRQMLIELLLARCPESEVIRDMAHQLGVEKARFKQRTGNKKCILCALCVRSCQEVVGVSAISLVHRGVSRQMTTPFNQDYSEACIGCGSCAYVCPTDAITMEDHDGKRVVKWPHNQMEFKMKQCKVCGKYWAPEKQIEYIARISGTPLEFYDVCPDCRY